MGVGVRVGVVEHRGNWGKGLGAVVAAAGIGAGFVA